MPPVASPIARTSGPEPLPNSRTGPAVVVYVWEYPLRLAHWALVVSIGILALTGFYLHYPFIASETGTPFLMGWIRFLHEAAGMVFLAFCLLRFYLFFGGNHWEGWRQIVPLRAAQLREMTAIMKFYCFLRPSSIPRVGHNSAAASSYIVVYAMATIEIVTGLVMFNWLHQSPILTPIVGWIPRFVNIQNIRLIHFLLTFAFIGYGIVHVHLCLLNAKLEKNGLMDSIFTGYKVIPEDELNDEDRDAIARSQNGKQP